MMCAIAGLPKRHPCVRADGPSGQLRLAANSNRSEQQCAISKLNVDQSVPSFMDLAGQPHLPAALCHTCTVQVPQCAVFAAMGERCGAAFQTPSRGYRAHLSSVCACRTSPAVHSRRKSTWQRCPQPSAGSPCKFQIPSPHLLQFSRFALDGNMAYASVQPQPATSSSTYRVERCLVSCRFRRRL